MPRNAKVKQNGAKGRLGKFFYWKCTLLLTVLTTMGICNVTASFLKWHDQLLEGLMGLGFRVIKSAMGPHHKEVIQKYFSFFFLVSALGPTIKMDG